MSIKLRKTAPNAHTVTIGTRELFFSYETLCGGTTADGTRYQTDVTYSRTTTRDLNAAGYKGAEKVSPEQLAQLAS
jgi:hypothetical protein